MPRSLYIVTGASRGLGAAIARRLLQPGHRLLTLSRQPDPALQAQAPAHDAEVEQWAVDLASPAPVAQQLEAWLGALKGDGFDDITLINNAAALGGIGPLHQAGHEMLATATRVGLEAPMVLTASFLNATRAWTCRKAVLNISSGLGRRAMAGSAVYCAVKAGLDHFTRALALDEALQPHGARVVSLAPGVIDTDMQVELRSADPRGFPEHAAFVQRHEQGQLTSPDDAAVRVLACLARPDFGQQPVADVRDA